MDAKQVAHYPAPPPVIEPGHTFESVNEKITRVVLGGRHPLAIPRVSLMLDLARALGWVQAGCYVDAPHATPAELARFHDPEYIAAVQRAEREQRVDVETSLRYHIGRNGNPIYGEVFRRPATACRETRFLSRPSLRPTS